MLCERLEDPLGADTGTPGSEVGLGMLPGTTVFHREKTTRRIEFHISPNSGMLAGHAAVSGYGYEIHTGHTNRGDIDPDRGNGLAPITIDGKPDGATSHDGWVMGTYVHGLLDNPAVLSLLLGNIARKHGLDVPVVPAFSIEGELDRLTAIVRGSLDMKLISSFISSEVPKANGAA